MNVEKSEQPTPAPWWKPGVWLLIAFLLGWAVAAILYNGSQPPVLRKVRVFNPSKDVIKQIEVKAQTALGLEPVATFVDVEPEHVVAKDAGSAGFVISEDPLFYATNVDKVVVSIYIADSESGTGKTLEDITLEVENGTFEEVCVIVDDHEDPNTWRVRATGFHQTHEEEPLISEEPLPAETEPKPGS